MKKKKTGVILTLAACLSGAVAAGAIPYLYNGEAYDLALNIFSSRKMVFQEGATVLESSAYQDERKGLRITGKTGAYIAVDETLSGAFDFSFVPETNLTSATFTFTNAKTEESFDLVTTYGATYVSAYVECEGEKVGLYYRGTKGLSDVTAIYNSVDTYTQYENSFKATDLSFEPQTMTVKLGDYAVWSLLSDYADGRKVSFAYDSFETYTVRMTFTATTGEASAILYEMNGQPLNSPLLIPASAPRLFAKFDYDGVVGEKYTLPKAYAYDVIDGAISPEDCTVAVSFGTQAVTIENGGFVPQAAGNYKVTYTTENQAGMTALQTYTLKVKEDFDGEMVFTDKLPAAELGQHTLGYFPAVEYVNGSITALGEIPVSAEIFRNNTSVKTIEKAAEGFSYAFEEVGEYKVVYKPVHAYYGKDVHAVEFTVKSDLIGYALDTPLQSVYTTADTVKIPTMTMTTPSGELQAVSTVRFPDGSLYSNTKIKTEQEGTYEVIYSAAQGEAAYEITLSFDALVAPQSLFTTEGDVTLTNGTYSHNASVDGLVVETVNGASITYKNVIDLNNYDYEGNPQSALLCELLIDPYTAFNADFVGLQIVLTDKYNPENYVTIVYGNTNDSVNTKWATLRAGFAGQPTVGLTDGKVGVDHTPAQGQVLHKNEQGFWFNGSMSATPNNQTAYALISTKIYFDYATRSIYSRRDDGEALIADLDHLSYFDALWEGFTTGECILTITPTDYSGSNGRFVLLNVDGHDFTNHAFRDETAPRLTVQTTAKDGSSEIPYGVAGTEYPVFTATAVDGVDGTLDVETRVYYNFNGHYLDIDVKDGSFLPEFAGEYLLVYQTADLSGNVSAYEVLIEVQEEDYYERNPLSVAWKEGYTTAVKEGERVALAEVESAYGGVGRVAYTVSVTAPDNGEVAFGVNGFRPAMSGIYKVNYHVTDFIGTKATVSYAVTVSKNDGVVFHTEELLLPAAFLSGIEYTLPQMTTVDFTGGNAQEKTAEISVTDQSGNAIALTNGKLVITDGSVTAVNVCYTCPGTQETVRYDNIPVQQILDEKGKFNFTSYFYGENVTVTQNAQSVGVTTTVRGATVEFLQNVLADKFSFKINVDSENTTGKFEAFSVLLSDAENPDIALKFTVTKNGDGALSSLNGSAPVFMAGSFTGNSTSAFVFAYSSYDMSFSDERGNSLGFVKTCVNGEAFAGFTSDKVNIRLIFEELEGQACMTVNQINSQIFYANVRSDTREPDITYEQTIGGNYAPGDTVTIPRFRGADVLGNTALFVTVRMSGNQYASDVNGNVLNAYPYYDGIQFTLREVGTYYIYLIAKDYVCTGGEIAYENTLNEPLVEISAIDRVDPTITLSGKIPSSAKVGETVKLPLPKVSDNNGEDGLTVSVFVIFEDNSIFRIREENGEYKFKPMQKGTYTIKYAVFDEYYNYAEVVGTIKVK